MRILRHRTVATAAGPIELPAQVVLDADTWRRLWACHSPAAPVAWRRAVWFRAQLREPAPSLTEP